MRSGGYLVVGVYGELIRPFLTSAEILRDLESGGISDNTLDSGQSMSKGNHARATYQTRNYALQEYSKWFVVEDYIEGGLNDLLDLIVMRKA
jgi:hypothetical protein